MIVTNRRRLQRARLQPSCLAQSDLPSPQNRWGRSVYEQQQTLTSRPIRSSARDSETLQSEPRIKNQDSGRAHMIRRQNSRSSRVRKNPYVKPRTARTQKNSTAEDPQQNSSRHPPINQKPKNPRRKHPPGAKPGIGRKSKTETGARARVGQHSIFRLGLARRGGGGWRRGSVGAGSGGSLSRFSGGLRPAAGRACERRPTDWRTSHGGDGLDSRSSTPDWRWRRWSKRGDRRSVAPCRARRRAAITRDYGDGGARGRGKLTPSPAYVPSA